MAFVVTTPLPFAKIREMTHAWDRLLPRLEISDEDALKTFVADVALAVRSPGGVATLGNIVTYAAARQLNRSPSAVHRIVNSIEWRHDINCRVASEIGRLSKKVQETDGDPHSRKENAATKKRLAAVQAVYGALEMLVNSDRMTEAVEATAKQFSADVQLATLLGMHKVLTAFPHDPVSPERIKGLVTLLKVAAVPGGDNVEELVGRVDEFFAAEVSTREISKEKEEEIVAESLGILVGDVRPVESRPKADILDRSLNSIVDHFGPKSKLAAVSLKQVSSRNAAKAADTERKICIVAARLLMWVNQMDTKTREKHWKTQNLPLLEDLLDG
jgi:hypothetical protein